MGSFKKISVAIFGLAIFWTPIVFADTPSISVDSLTPGTTVFARGMITFHVASSGFSPRLYLLSDSFGGSSISNTNINAGGNFFWSPETSDVGTHTLTITGNDFSGTIVRTTQTVTVAPLPSISLQSISPGNKIMPGTLFTFKVATPGFSKPTFSVSDSFGGSSVVKVAIGTSGDFSWTPQTSDNGEHTISVYTYDSEGHSASASVDVLVGEGPTLVISSVTPGTTVPLGQNITFNAVPMNFAPTAFSVLDNFPGTTISNAHINTVGIFSWMPSGSDVGTHILTVKGIVGMFGKTAETTQTITVLGPGGVPAPTPTVLGASVASTDSSDATVNALRAQLLELNAQIAAQSGTAASAAFSGGTFTTYLHRGMDGDEVIRLQKVLAQHGFFSGEASGHFGPLTVAAVKKFQAAHGLDQLGIVGPATRTALNGLSSGTVAGASSAPSEKYVFENFIDRGQNGTDVVELQKHLAVLGFFSGEPTGYFGSVTEAAVKAFQTAHGIRAVGYVGPGTRAALNQ